MNLRLACFALTLVGLTTAVRLPAAGEEPPPFAAELSANWRARLAPFVTPRCILTNASATSRLLAYNLDPSAR